MNPMPLDNKPIQHDYLTNSPRTNDDIILESTPNINILANPQGDIQLTVCISGWLFTPLSYLPLFYAILPQAKLLASTRRIPSKVAHLKTHRPQKRRAVVLLFLLHIAVHCRLFLTYKASMATGSICLPAWRPELPDCSRGLAASDMQLSVANRTGGIYKEIKELLAESGFMMAADAGTVSTKSSKPSKLYISSDPGLGQ